SSCMHRAAGDFLDQVNQGLSVITARHQTAVGRAHEDLRELQAKQTQARAETLKDEQRQAELEKNYSELQKRYAELEAKWASLEPKAVEAEALINAQIDAERENEAHSKTRINKLLRIVGGSAS